MRSLLPELTVQGSIQTPLEGGPWLQEGGAPRGFKGASAKGLIDTAHLCAGDIQLWQEIRRVRLWRGPNSVRIRPCLGQPLGEVE